MPQSNFVHLHVHSEYSLLDGASRIPDIVAKAKKLNMPAVAITDHGNIYNGVQFYCEAKKEGIKPILGCEMYVAPRSRFDRDSELDKKPFHITILAKDQEGYKNLNRLVSLASLEGFYSKPRIDRESLEKYSKGLVVLSGCMMGEVPRYLLNGEFEKAKACANWHRGIFGDDYYIEVQNIGLEEQRRILERIVPFAREMEIKMAVSNDTHYTDKEDAYMQDVLMCIQTGKVLTDTKRMNLGSDQFYMKDSQEMQQVLPNLEEAFTNTLEIAEKCSVELKMGENHLPRYEVPKGETLNSYIGKLAWQGIEKIYGVPDQTNTKRLIPPEIVSRVNYELDVIKKMEYSGYFLIVQDFINYAKNSGIQVGPGRGSAAGSIVAYALGITNIDPLRYNLLFERFLNPERISMPDIDVDFCIERRQEVIDYVSKKFGSDHVAQIVTFGTMAARAAIRDVGRVLGVPLPEVDKIAKLVPFGPNVDLKSALETVADLHKLYKSDERIKNLIDTSLKVEGMTRHASVHAAGVVISDEPLTEYVALQRVSEGQLVTQYTMNDLEKIGLLKMDFLGLRNLTMIADAVKIIKRTEDLDLDMNNLPVDDVKTYQLLCSGDTFGIFQLESRGMRGIIKELKPMRFEEIIALLALYRPGPLESGMVDDFIKRKHKKVEVKYDLPELEPILKETYGVILYQEQVMQIASTVAGFTLGQADVLRRAMGKKKASEMAKQREIFVEGAIKRRVSKNKATHLFNLCDKFAGYGFNKSHSASYAVISYQTAYLKANYPLEFMAALLTSVMGNADKVTEYINECKRMQIRILPPDINESFRNFTAVKDKYAIRFGLTAIKNVGVAAIDSILKCKKEQGAFKSFMDFCRRVDLRTVNKRVIESLIKCGAIDSLSSSRAYLLAILDKALDKVNREQKEKMRGQEMLFGSTNAEKVEEDEITLENPVPDMPPDQMLKYEKELLGLYVSGHPLDHIKKLLEEQTATRIVQVKDKKEGTSISIGGMLSNCRRFATKKGDAMLVADIEDLTGKCSLIVFPKSFEKYANLLLDEAIILVKGKVNRDNRTEEINVAGDIVEPLDESEKEQVLMLDLSGVENKNHLAKIKELISSHKGLYRVVLKIDQRLVDLPDAMRVEINPFLITEIENILGFGSAFVKLIKKEKNHENRFIGVQV